MNGHAKHLTVRLLFPLRAQEHNSVINA